MTKRVTLPQSLRRMISDDPSQILLAAVEEAMFRVRAGTLPLVLRQQKPRERRLGWVHATTAIGDCDFVIAAEMLGQRPPRTFGPSTQRIMDNGTYMHLRYYSYFYMLRSPWKVRIARIVRRWPLVGEVDVDVFHPDLGQFFVELKSMNSSGWRVRYSPREDHMAQLNVYMGLGAVDRGQIWYENKDNQEPKSFVVAFDSFRWTDLWKRVHRIHDRLMQGKLPKLCPGCQTPDFCGSVKMEQKVLEEIDAERQRATGPAADLGL